MPKTLSIIIIVLIIFSAGGYFLYMKYYKTQTATSPSLSRSPLSSEKWHEGGVAIAGKYADADLVELGNGKWRMYYSVEPEVPGNKLELYSGTSTDGITWSQEEGVRKEFATFPSVIKLADGKYRLYFQNAGVIKSALSADGLSWTDEEGVRIDANEEGVIHIENVGAQTVIQLDDGSFLMVYRVMIKERYSQEVPNDSTQILYFAVSKDGLTWEKKNLAADSRNETFQGLIDGAELVKWDNDQIRLYFWSYKGVYHLVFENGIFSQEPDFDFTNNKNPNLKLAPNPPGDPTLSKIQGKWFMYYGQHEKGIYYATLEDK